MLSLLDDLDDPKVAKIALISLLIRVSLGCAEPDVALAVMVNASLNAMRAVHEYEVAGHA